MCVYVAGICVGGRCSNRLQPTLLTHHTHKNAPQQGQERQPGEGEARWAITVFELLDNDQVGVCRCIRCLHECACWLCVCLGGCLGCMCTHSFYLLTSTIHPSIHPPPPFHPCPPPLSPIPPAEQPRLHPSAVRGQHRLLPRGAAPLWQQQEADAGG